MLKNDSLANVLYIDLSKRTFTKRRREKLFNAWLGGTGVATQLLHEECPQGCDPLSADNPIIFAVGPMTALFPLGSKTVAMFKSPHTGDLGESHCGGRSAVAMRMAGYGAIVIKGASDIPVYISLDGSGVHFRDATTLWGMGSFSTGRVIREKETGAGLRTIMRIGKGGENLVSYACVTTETYRHFGRLGLGAVFGSKKLKAVVIAGKSSLPVSDPKLYRKVYKEIYDRAVSPEVMKKYHDLGTAENVIPLNNYGGLPTRNLQAARFEDAGNLSGEHLAEYYLGRRLACSNCPVGCIHIAALREPYEGEAYFYKTSMISYDYEPIYSLGSMLGISDAAAFLKLMDRVEAWGIDAMSAGVVLAWLTEAFERNLVTEKETLGLKPEWGNADIYIRVVRSIVEQPNDFYAALARGVDYASSVYGGADFALSFPKNEMPGYHTGPAAHVGTLIGARHSHLDNAGYSFDQKVLSVKETAPGDLARELLKEERWRQILSSLVICFFARTIYQPDVVARLLPLAGFELSEEDLWKLGGKIHSEKYRFKVREGFSLDNLRLPKRIFETATPVPQMDEAYVKQTIEEVKKILAAEGLF